MPSVFVLLKKSDVRFKDLEFPTIYSRCLEVKKADFACGHKFFRDAFNLPEVKPEKIKNSAYYLKNYPRNKYISFYKSSEKYNKKLINYLQEFALNGDPTPRTLNFYTKYIYVLKDL